MTIEITVPTLGESITEATVAKWFKNVGNPIAVDETLLELETDKVSVEVPAPAAGVLAEITAVLHQRQGGKLQARCSAIHDPVTIERHARVASLSLSENS